MTPQSLFVSEELYAELEAAVEAMQLPVTTREIELQTRRPMEGNRGRDLIGETGDKLVSRIRAAIRSRVFRD